MTYDIEIQNATVSYRKNIALRNVSLTIRQKSFTAVVGPNGAGKTTLLTLINGLGTIRCGTITIFGCPITSHTIHSIRKEIGYVPQHLRIDPRMPVLVHDVVMLGRYAKIGMFRSPGKNDHCIVDKICERIGITDLRSRPIGHLSGGESQKVSLARALAQEPRILLLDEPTANLDPRAQSEITAVIEQVYQRDRLTILFVTHILSHLPDVCSDAILLKHGRIIAHGNARDVLTEEKLSKVYDHKVEPPLITGKTEYV